MHASEDGLVPISEIEALGPVTPGIVRMTKGVPLHGQNIAMISSAEADKLRTDVDGDAFQGGSNSRAQIGRRQTRRTTPMTTP